METMKISIITPSFNQAEFLEETILSVLNQKYPNLEYIIVDGGSTDGSVEIIKRYEPYLAYWVSERDRGQVEALNKGVAKVTGDVAAFINSDDVYLPGTFGAVSDYFRRFPDCEWLCGDTIMFGEGYDTELVRAVVPKTAAHCLSWAFKAPQPGMFWKRDLIKYGFQERWPYDFDCDLYVRLLLDGHKCAHLDLPVAAYRLHGSSKTIAEGNRQIEEFDQLAEYYESQLRGEGRRWCLATLLLRRSYNASVAGRTSEATACLLRALLKHPEGLRRRPFWGCLRQLLRNSTLRTS